MPGEVTAEVKDVERKTVQDFLEILRSLHNDDTIFPNFKEKYNKWSKTFEEEWNSCDIAKFNAFHRLQPSKLVRIISTAVLSLCFLENCTRASMMYLTLALCFYLSFIAMNAVSAVLISYFSTSDMHLFRVHEYFQAVLSMNRRFNHKLRFVQRRLDINPNVPIEFQLDSDYPTKVTNHVNLFSSLFGLYNIYGVLIAFLITTLCSYLNCEIFAILEIFTLSLLVSIAVEKDIKSLTFIRKMRRKRNKMKKLTEDFNSWFENKCELKRALETYDVSDAILISVFPKESYENLFKDRYLNFAVVFAKYEMILHTNLSKDDLEKIISILVYGRKRIANRGLLKNESIELTDKASRESFYRHSKLPLAYKHASRYMAPCKKISKNGNGVKLIKKQKCVNLKKKNIPQCNNTADNGSNISHDEDERKTQIPQAVLFDSNLELRRGLRNSEMKESTYTINRKVHKYVRKNNINERLGEISDIKENKSASICSENQSYKNCIGNINKTFISPISLDAEKGDEMNMNDESKEKFNGKKIILNEANFKTDPESLKLCEISSTDSVSSVLDSKGKIALLCSLGNCTKQFPQEVNPLYATNNTLLQPSNSGISSISCGIDSNPVVSDLIHKTPQRQFDDVEKSVDCPKNIETQVSSPLGISETGDKNMRERKARQHGTKLVQSESMSNRAIKRDEINNKDIYLPQTQNVTYENNEKTSVASNSSEDETATGNDYNRSEKSISCMQTDETIMEISDEDIATLNEITPDFVVSETQQRAFKDYLNDTDNTNSTETRTVAKNRTEQKSSGDYADTISVARSNDEFNENSAHTPKSVTAIKVQVTQNRTEQKSSRDCVDTTGVASTNEKSKENLSRIPETDTAYPNFVLENGILKQGLSQTDDTVATTLPTNLNVTDQSISPRAIPSINVVKPVVETEESKRDVVQPVEIADASPETVLNETELTVSAGTLHSITATKNAIEMGKLEQKISQTDDTMATSLPADLNETDQIISPRNVVKSINGTEKSKGDVIRTEEITNASGQTVLNETEQTISAGTIPRTNSSKHVIGMGKCEQNICQTDVTMAISLPVDLNETDQIISPRNVVKSINGTEKSKGDVIRTEEITNASGQTVLNETEQTISAGTIPRTNSSKHVIGMGKCEQNICQTDVTMAISLPVDLNETDQRISPSKNFEIVIEIEKSKQDVVQTEEISDASRQIVSNKKERTISGGSISGTNSEKHVTEIGKLEQEICQTDDTAATSLPRSLNETDKIISPSINAPKPVIESEKSKMDVAHTDKTMNNSRPIEQNETKITTTNDISNIIAEQSENSSDIKFSKKIHSSAASLEVYHSLNERKAMIADSIRLDYSEKSSMNSSSVGYPGSTNEETCGVSRTDSSSNLSRFYKANDDQLKPGGEENVLYQQPKQNKQKKRQLFYDSAIEDDETRQEGENNKKHLSQEKWHLRVQLKSKECKIYQKNKNYGNKNLTKTELGQRERHLKKELTIDPLLAEDTADILDDGKNTYSEVPRIENINQHTHVNDLEHETEMKHLPKSFYVENWVRCQSSCTEVSYEWSIEATRPPTGSSDDKNFYFHSSTSASDTSTNPRGNFSDTSDTTSGSYSKISKSGYELLREEIFEDSTSKPNLSDGRSANDNEKLKPIQWENDLSFYQIENSENSSTLHGPMQNNGACVTEYSSPEEKPSNPIRYRLKCGNLDVGVLDASSHFTIRLVRENEEGNSNLSPKCRQLLETSSNSGSIRDFLLPAGTSSQRKGSVLLELPSVGLDIKDSENDLLMSVENDSSERPHSSNQNASYLNENIQTDDKSSEISRNGESPSTCRNTKRDLSSTFYTNLECTGTSKESSSSQSGLLIGKQHASERPHSSHKNASDLNESIRIDDNHSEISRNGESPSTCRNNKGDLSSSFHTNMEGTGTSKASSSSQSGRDKQHANEIHANKSGVNENMPADEMNDNLEQAILENGGTDSKDFLFKTQDINLNYKLESETDPVSVTFRKNPSETKLTFKSEHKKLYLKMRPHY